MKFALRKVVAAVAALTLTAGGVGVAAADTVTNTLDNVADATLEVMSLTHGGVDGSTSFTIQVQNQKLDGNNGCNFTGGSDPKSLVVAVASSNTSKATVSPTSLTFTACDDPKVVTVTPGNAGSATISLSESSRSDNLTGSFDFAPASFTASVARAAGSVSIGNIPTTAAFGGSFTPVYTKLGDGTASTSSLTPSTCSVGSSGSVSFDSPGTCTLQASVAEGTNHLAATGAAQSFTIAKAAGSVAISNVPSNAVFGGSFTPTYTKAGDGAALTSSLTSGTCTVNQAGVVSFVAAGTCTLQASVGDGTNHLAATGNEQGFSIAKAAGAVAINNIPSPATFGESFTPTFQKSGDGTPSVASLTTGTCSVANGVVNFVAAGTCTLQASVTESANHLAATGNQQTFTIAKAAGSVSITNPPTDAVFGGSFTPSFAKAGNGDASVASLTTGTCSVANGVVSFVAAGTCTLQASVAEGTNHLAATGQEQSFTIAKAAGSVSIDNLPTGAVFGGSFTPTYTKAGNGDASVASLTTGTCSVANGVVSFVAAGTCTLQAGVAEGTNHDAATGDQQTFTIAKAAGSVSISNLPLTARVGSTFVPEYARLGDGAASTASLTTGICTTSSGLVTFVAAGTCNLQASVAAGTNHLAAEGALQSITVNAAGSWTAVQQPINAATAPTATNISTFKAGRGVIPVKFQWLDANGLVVKDATVAPQDVVLELKLMGSSGEGTVVNESLATGSANSGWIMRYDATTGTYVYNLAANSLKGTYSIQLKHAHGNSAVFYFKVA